MSLIISKDREITRYEKFRLSMMGWRTGAGGRPMNELILKNGQPADVKLYDQGYAAGRRASKKATAACAKRFKVSNNTIAAAVLRGQA